MKKYPDYLVHFNPNHDPKTGQFAKSNKYQYANGYLTSEGKQRWMTQYYNDVQRAAKKKQNTTNIQTKINSEEWIKQDRKSAVGRGIWMAATIGVGGVYVGKKKYTWNENAVNELLKTHSGDSVYKIR